MLCILLMPACSMCEHACARGDMDQDWFQSLLRRLGFQPGQHAPWSTEAMDCVSLRRLLLRHALACQPTAAQQASLPDGQRVPYYYSSYLSYMQCMYACRFSYQAEASSHNSGPNSKSSMSGASMHQKYRVMEILEELDRGQRQQDKEGLCRELQILSSQDGASLLPAELQAKARLHLTMAGMRGFEPNIQGWSVNQVAEVADHHMESHARNDSITVQDQSQKVQVAITAASPTCMHCGKGDCKLMKCGKCGAVQYCSRECQVAHWRQHKAVCKHANV